MSKRTCITVLTWNRLDALKNTLELFEKYNGSEHDIFVVDNGSTDGTVNWLTQQVISQRLSFLSLTKNLGCFEGTMAAWKVAHEEGYDFILNLQDDFPCTAPVPFETIEKYLDDNIDVGYVRLNKKKDQKKNIVTGEPIEFTTNEKIDGYKFKKYNYHATFNPTIMKSWLVPIFYTNQKKIRERGLMEKYAKTGLKAARIYPEMFETLPQRPREGEWKN